jgi:hypothetical protein
MTCIKCNSIFWKLDSHIKVQKIKLSLLAYNHNFFLGGREGYAAVASTAQYNPKYMVWYVSTQRATTLARDNLIKIFIKIQVINI